MVIEQILKNLKEYCESQHGSCIGCQYASDCTDDYACRIQQITGTYPDTWKE